ncbi:MAG: VOC family protein [Gemmatimonadota bacterium]|nr:VOC family protein [Gemmatimonadota bacterium]
MTTPERTGGRGQGGPEILGLHHVTATVDGAQPDLTFYRDVLGLRLVKKTVNFDNPRVYHLYYGNETGDPGTLMTTFPYGGWGVRPGRHGNGQIKETRFAVPPGSAEAWHSRLSESGHEAVRGETSFGEPGVVVLDPSGLVIRLVEVEDVRAPWTGGEVDGGMAITGIHSVTFPVQRVGPSLDLATGLLGWQEKARQGESVRLVSGSGGPGAIIDIEAAPGAADGVNGLGTVHHVAMAVADDAAQEAFRQRLLEAGHAVTEVRDRQYFRSIYFREPGGVLYEIATLPPGFAIDEPVSSLGEGLKLPPWEEANRSRIEEGLAPLL